MFKKSYTLIVRGKKNFIVFLRVVFDESTTIIYIITQLTSIPTTSFLLLDTADK